MKIKDLVFDEYGGFISVNGKTGPRRIRLIGSVPDIKAWMNVHPFKNNQEAPFFIALGKNSYGGYLSDSIVQKIVANAGKRANISRHIYPHLFRHSNATHWARFLKEPEMRIRYGWSRTSDMPSVYVHLSGEDLDERILVSSGLKEPGANHKTVQKISAKVCTRCNEENPSSNTFCQKCYYPLDLEAINQIDAVKQVINEFLTAKLLQNPDIVKDLPKMIEEWGKK